MKPEVLHLYITDKCTNDCPLCCNKNYDFINGVKQVTEEELSSVHTVCLTGGDPFLSDKLNDVVESLRSRENIKNIYVFTSGYACLLYLNKYKALPNIDGITFSPKSEKDWAAIDDFIYNYDEVARKYTGYDDLIHNLKSNRIYAFIEKYDDCNYSIDNKHLGISNDDHEDLDCKVNDHLSILNDAHEYLGCKVFFRMWTTEFNSPENEIFRKL